MYDLKDEFVLTGSIRGDIHFIKRSCLYEEKDMSNQMSSKDKMSLAKSYAAHVSFINQCETTTSNTINDDYLYTTGITD